MNGIAPLTHAGSISGVRFGTRQPVNIAFSREVALPTYPEVALEERFIKAAGEGKLVSAWLLLRKGININAQTPTGETALMAAAKGGHYRVVRFLLKRNAEVNARTYRTRETALILATESKSRQHRHVIRLLLEHGAKINVRTDEPFPRTALKNAINNNDTKVRDILLTQAAREVCT